MSRNIKMNRDEAEATIEILLNGVAKDSYEAGYVAPIVSRIVHTFGISDSYTLKRWKGDVETLEYFLYPLPDNHPSVRLSLIHI